MTFWAYMLHCRGGAYYVGHTDNLDHRIAQHQSGAIASYTADHLPVTLVWSQDFATRYEAKEAERRIKGWSRAKKMALIRGDWDRISTLAKGKNGPANTVILSTDVQHANPSPHPARPELVEGLSFSLTPHPQTPPSEVAAVHGVISVDPQTRQIRLEYRVENARGLETPGPLLPERTDELWRTTCFELFLREHGQEGYAEFNFSPSAQWAAYSFDGYRSGMRNAAMHNPGIVGMNEGSAYILYVERGPALPSCPLNLALSAVIEETDGTKSYWALAHPPGRPPDFHHPDCFALTLPAPEAP